MLSSKENSFLFKEENFIKNELKFFCSECKTQFLDYSDTPYCLPCADLICGRCLKIAKETESFFCVECSCSYTKAELEKIRSNKEIMKMIKYNKEGKGFNGNNEQDSCTKKSNSICKIHNKSNLPNLYCFYHQKKICQNCLIEHQYPKCKLKIWSEEDSFLLLNEIKMRYTRINDVESNLEEHFMNLESRLFKEDNHMDIDVFTDFVQLYDKLNKIEENRKGLIYNYLEDENFLKSSLELSIYMTMCEKLIEKTILTNPYCLKFITSNFEITKDFHSVFHTVNNCYNLVICVSNRSNDTRVIYIKYNDDFYILENLFGTQASVDTQTKLKLIPTELRFRKGVDETETVLIIENKSFKHYDIFIFDNLLHIMNSNSKGLTRFKESTQVLYFNDKYFYFDFLNFIEINQNNYLKITFERDEKISNMYLKLVRFTSSLGEFVVDYMIIDNPFSFHKIINKCKIRREFGGYFKTLQIERNLEIRENQIKILLDNGEINAKVESITYFRITI